MNEYKSFDRIPDLPKEPDVRITNRDRIAIFKPHVKEPVVDGDIKWKPVDKVAARVVRKAQYYEKPPNSGPVFRKKDVMISKFPTEGRLKAHRGRDDQGVVRDDLINIYEFAPLAIMNHEKDFKEQAVKPSEDLVKRAHDVVEACDYLVNHFKEPFDEYKERIKKELQSTRETRIALESETRQLMNALKEVRGFFIDKDYELERARLAEFISLCERLKSLKDSGFLDSVAETMLNLATRH